MKAISVLLKPQLLVGERKANSISEIVLLCSLLPSSREWWEGVGRAKT
jgi:hypothetical protein